MREWHGPYRIVVEEEGRKEEERKRNKNIGKCGKKDGRVEGTRIKEDKVLKRTKRRVERWWEHLNREEWTKERKCVDGKFIQFRGENDEERMYRDLINFVKGSFNRVDETGGREHSLRKRL